MGCLGFSATYMRQCNENLAEGLGSVTPSRMSLEKPWGFVSPWKHCSGKVRSAHQSRTHSSAITRVHLGFCSRDLCLKMLGGLLIHNRHISFVNLPQLLESPARTLSLFDALKLLINLFWLKEVLTAPIQFWEQQSYSRCQDLCHCHGQNKFGHGFLVLSIHAHECK